MAFGMGFLGDLSTLEVWWESWKRLERSKSERTKLGLCSNRGPYPSICEMTIGLSLQLFFSSSLYKF